MGDRFAVRIWQPRYWDRKVLIDCLKVHPGENYVYFCADRNLTDLYRYDGDSVIGKCSVCSNGKIPCYEIPLERLISMGPLPGVLQKAREEELGRFNSYRKGKKRNGSK